MTDNWPSPDPVFYLDDLEWKCLLESGSMTTTSVSTAADENSTSSWTELEGLFNNDDGMLDNTFMNGTMLDTFPSTSTIVTNGLEPVGSTNIQDIAPVTPSPAHLTMTTSPRRKQRKDHHAPRPVSPHDFLLSLNNNNNNVRVKMEPEFKRPQRVNKGSRPRKATCGLSKGIKKADIKKELQGKENKPKMYEMDGPESKAARLAKFSREKKKQDMEMIQKQNEELKITAGVREAENKALMAKIAVMEAQLEARERETRAKEALQTIYPSIHRLLNTIMPTLKAQWPGQWRLEAAPWFSQVEIPSQAHLLATNRSFFTPPPSSYIHLKISPAEYKVIVDYDPNFVPEFVEFSENY